MPTEARGRDLFIVDNSVEGWTGIRYLEEWCGIAKAFDIATGYFEIGALLALDPHWQGLDKLRILMGADTTHRSRKLLLEATTTGSSTCWTAASARRPCSMDNGCRSWVTARYPVGRGARPAGISEAGG